jgi:hypothetical protein
MKKIFLFFILCNLTNAENLSKQNPLAEEKIILIGPEALRLKESLTITAEKVILEGTIFTEGFELTIITRVLEIKKNAQIVTFENPQKAQEASLSKLLPPSELGQGSKGIDGLKGSRGFNGYNGQIQPGAIRIFAGIIHSKLNINANGQKGGNGGKGQDGQDGGPGGSGSKAKLGFLGIWTDEQGGPGGQGGNPGPGGPGAAGGAGGNAAPVEIHYGKTIQEGENFSIEVSNKPGDGGDSGEPGENGKSGPGGKGGEGVKLFGFIPDGNGVSGKNGEELSNLSEKGTKGVDGQSSKDNLIVKATFEKITHAYMKAQILTDVVNQSRKIDSFIRDLIVTTENNFSPENLQSRIRLLKKESDRLKNQNIINTQNTQVFEKLESLLKSISETKTFNAQDIQKLNSLSKKNIDKTHEQAFESMKTICKEIINIKKEMKYETIEIVANSAYKIFGPAALEDWVLKNETAGTRESLLLLHNIKPKLIGSDKSYPIKTINDSENFDRIKKKELRNVLP